MRAAIEDFILHLATERGLSDNYQISTRLSLEGFAQWLEHACEDDVSPSKVTLEQISDYLAHKKRLGLSPASIKLVVVAIKIFFRWLTARRRIEHDPAEVLPLPRT
jgi:integrase/recombinase XerD